MLYQASVAFQLASFVPQCKDWVPGRKVMPPLVTAVNDIPAVAEAVNVIVSSVSYVTPVMVTLLLPFVMVPVVGPPNVPAPEAFDNVMVVLLFTTLAAPPASCACTVTLKGAPTVTAVGTDA